MVMRVAKAMEWKPLRVVSSRSSSRAKLRKRAGEAAFHDPAARQQHEASFGHGVLDHFEPYARCCAAPAALGPG